jgi:hypothetical protein
MSVGQPSAGIKDGLDFDGIESLRVPAVQTVKMPSSMERQSQDCTRGVGPMYNDLIDERSRGGCARLAWLGFYCNAQRETPLRAPGGRRGSFRCGHPA